MSDGVKLPPVRAIHALVGAVVLIVSIIGYVIGVPLITQEGCIASGGIYTEGICYPAGTTFEVEDTELPPVEE